MVETYYEQLGVGRDASAADVRAAFRERLLETHPDVRDADDAKQLTQDLLHARGVLRDFRSEYDEMLNELGPTLGHRSFEQWWETGQGLYDVGEWIADHRPDSVDDPGDLFETGGSTAPDPPAREPKYDTGRTDEWTDWHDYERPADEEEPGETEDRTYWEQWRDEHLTEGDDRTSATTRDAEADRTADTAEKADSAARQAESADRNEADQSTIHATAGGEFYDRLGVAPAATREEIHDRFETVEGAFSAADRATVEGEQRYQEYVKAFEILDDPRLRAWYDALGHEEFTDGWASLRGWPPDVDRMAYVSERGYDAVEVATEDDQATKPGAPGRSWRRVALALAVVGLAIIGWLFLTP